jgi:hypothetical protein
MKELHSIVNQILTHLCALFNSILFNLAIIVLHAFKRVEYNLRNARLAKADHSLEAVVVLDWQYSRDNWTGDSNLSALLHKGEK